MVRAVASPIAPGAAGLWPALGVELSNGSVISGCANVCANQMCCVYESFRVQRVFLFSKVCSDALLVPTALAKGLVYLSVYTTVVDCDFMYVREGG